jgi:glycosyltransferase involved in cell wall biosynthesis
MKYKIRGTNEIFITLLDSIPLSRRNTMQDFSGIKKKFSDLKCCVIIPTYNNDRTLEKIIGDVLNYTDDLIVVNDGSTDETSRIIGKFTSIQVVNISKNRGKGIALKKGFDLALEKGFRYAVTIDSDGQHFPADFQLFLDKIEQEPDSVIIGARNMEQASVPGTSNFGHKFSIFWFKVETGLKIDDVQSGFRLYPLRFLKDMRLYTKKYEFEVEVLVRLAWRGVKVLSVPVNVYYPPREERVSHFRKVNDFTRVSIVNSILVFMALLLVRPFLFTRSLKKKSFKGFIKEYVVDSNDSNSKLAWSVALGLFVGLTPFWGWQLIIAFGVSYVFKLNKFVTVAASNISIPPILPFLLILSYFTGGLVLGLETKLSYGSGITLEWVKHNLLQYVVGSFILGTVFAVVLGFLTFLLLQIFRKKRPDQENKLDSTPDNF